MSRADIRIVDVGGRNVTPVRRFVTVAAQEAITAGEPVKINPAGTKMYYVTLLTNGDPVITPGSWDYFVGIAAADSTHTTSADGYVDVYLDTPGTIYGAKAKTATQVDTQSEVDSRQFYRVVLDLTSSKFTIDGAAATATTNGLIILGGDPSNSELHFAVAEQATWRFFGSTLA